MYMISKIVITKSNYEKANNAKVRNVGCIIYYHNMG